VFVCDAGRDVFAALPGCGRIEEATVAAGVQIRAAFHADLFECRILETDPLLAALVALEHFRTEPARRPPARRAFHALALRLGSRTLLTVASVVAGAISATVLITLMFVLPISHIHLTNNK
jgi:hypothetical protein